MKYKYRRLFTIQHEEWERRGRVLREMHAESERRNAAPNCLDNAPKDGTFLTLRSYDPHGMSTIEPVVWLHDRWQTPVSLFGSPEWVGIDAPEEGSTWDRMKKRPKDVPPRTTITISVDPDGRVHMHRQCHGNWTETAADIAKVLAAVQADIDGAASCPARPTAPAGGAR